MTIIPGNMIIRIGQTATDLVPILIFLVIVISFFVLGFYFGKKKAKKPNESMHECKTCGIIHTNREISCVKCGALLI
jgi:hypothetical protein